MTICDACHEWEAKGYHGFDPTCSECQVREIASGPLFFEAQKAKRITADYEQHMRKKYGAKWEEAHKAVKVMYRRIKERK